MTFENNQIDCLPECNNSPKRSLPNAKDGATMKKNRIGLKRWVCDRFMMASNGDGIKKITYNHMTVYITPNLRLSLHFIGRI